MKKKKKVTGSARAVPKITIPVLASAQKSTPRSVRQSAPPAKLPVPRDAPRLVAALEQALKTDRNDHKTMLELLQTVRECAKEALPPSSFELLIRVLECVFGSALPFVPVRRGYKQIHPGICGHTRDIDIAYELLALVSANSCQFSQQLLKTLVLRLTSASIKDRQRATDALMSLDAGYASTIVKLCSLELVPAPPYGAGMLLDLIAHFLPLIVDLENGFSRQLECIFHVLHFAPHYQTFSKNLTAAILELESRISDLAHADRMFILNNWPRLDPQRAVLFMQEATALCVGGPDVVAVVWEKLAFRSCSVQWQIAMEGMTFIERTIERMSGVDFSILRFLLEDTIQRHWAVSVRERAKDIIKLVPEVEPRAPTVLPVDTWAVIKSTAQANYPRIRFGPRRPMT